MSTPTQAQFWDQRYAEPGFSFGDAPNVFLAGQKHRLKPGLRALVPGDGEGRNGVWLAEQGLDVVTVDASIKGVEKAQALAAERGVTIEAQQADLTAWDWPRGAFDVVVSIYLHFPAAVRPEMHRRMAEALKPGGLVLLEGYTPRQLAHRAAGSVGGPPDATMLFDPETLRQEFAGLEIIELQEIEADLAEGKRHTGRSAVVRLIARRAG
jgi:cyclopropane fatty-acyl-phospholipid synthase-like methyltransferase